MWLVTFLTNISIRCTLSQTMLMLLVRFDLTVLHIACSFVIVFTGLWLWHLHAFLTFFLVFWFSVIPKVPNILCVLWISTCARWHNICLAHYFFFFLNINQRVLLQICAFIKVLSSSPKLHYWLWRLWSVSESIVIFVLYLTLSFNTSWASHGLLFLW